jgi:hypothetical protein
MHEFNGWAVVLSDERTEDADRALFARLRAEIAGVDEPTRLAFHVGETINGHRSFTVSGLRNHHHAAVPLLFEWLSRASRRSYGLLYEQDDEWPDQGARWHATVLRNGTFLSRDDPFFA